MDRILRLRKKLSPFSSLANKDFRLFVFGFFVSQLGFQGLTVAVSWQMYQLTKSALALGLIGLISFLPTIFFSMIGGVAADRIERKKLLILTQLGFALVAVALGCATFYHLISPTLIYIIIACQFVISSFYAPVRQSVIPSIVPDENLLNAISLNTLARQSAIIIGPSLAGFILAFYGTEFVYFSSAIVLALMVITIIPINIPRLERAHMPSFNLSSIKEGIDFVLSSRIMTSMILLDFTTNFFGSATSLLPIFAVEILHADSRGLGLLYAATSIGGVLAGLVMSSFKHIHHQGKIILICAFLFGLATIGFGFSQSFLVTCFFLLIIGASDMTSTILRNNIRQLLTPNYLRGRMTGINILFAQGGPKLGDAEAGLVASLVSAPFSVISGGIVCLVAIAVIMWTHPKLILYKGRETGI